jgi:Fur family ferric uptake transcriptional regulator
MAPVRKQRSRQPDPELHLDPALVAALTTAGQRLTRHRASVIVALLTADRPLTVDDVVAAADVPLSTAYRNLTELCDAGVATRVNSTDRADRFELTEMFSRRHHHHHLICTQCGSVADFDTSASLEKAIAKELAAVGGSSTFVASGHVFDILGRCDECGG